MGAGSRSRRDHAGSDGYVHDNWRSDKKCTKDGKCPKCMKYKEKFCNRAFMQQSCCTTCGCNKKERRRERRTVDIERQRSTRSTVDMWSDSATAYKSLPSTGRSGETLTGSVDVCKNHCGSKNGCAGFTRLSGTCYFYTSVGPMVPQSNKITTIFLGITIFLGDFAQVSWWQKNLRFFTRRTPYGGACEVPVTLEECREHRAVSEAAQPARLPLPPTWYNSYSPSNFNGAAAFCESKGRRLATYSEYCAAGSVFGGKKSDGDQWAPYSGDGDNQWVQVGTSGHAECKKHTPQHGKPAWGTSTDKHYFENYVLCANTVDPLTHSSFGGNWPSLPHGCQLFESSPGAKDSRIVYNRGGSGAYNVAKQERDSCVMPVSYKGCYNTAGQNIGGYSGRNTLLETCADIASTGSKPFFGMEWPQGSTTPGTASCANAMTKLPTVQVADAECGAPYNGRRLGGPWRVAVYARVSKDKSHWCYASQSRMVCRAGECQAPLDSDALTAVRTAGEGYSTSEQWKNFTDNSDDYAEEKKARDEEEWGQYTAYTWPDRWSAARCAGNERRCLTHAIFRENCCTTCQCRGINPQGGE